MTIKIGVLVAKTVLLKFHDILNKIQRLNNKLCLNAFKKAKKASLPNFKNAHLKVYSE